VTKDVCPTCHGERQITVDHWDPKRDHWTTEEPCPDCSDDDYEEIEGEELDALEKQFWHSLAGDTDDVDLP
jgi:hypothetical protein